MTPRPRRATTAAASAALLLTLTAACSDNGQASDPPPSPTPTPTPTATAEPTPSPTPATPEEQAVADVTELLDRYVRVRDRVAKNPEIPLRQLERVAIASHLGLLRNRYENARNEQRTYVGDETIEIIEITDVTLDYEEDAHPPVVPVVALTACFDVTNLDILDADGSSIVSGDRIDRVVMQLLVANYEWPDAPNAGWRVASTTNTGEPCDD